jgi:hypothetical protein
MRRTISRSLLAAAVSGVSPLSFPHGREVINSLVNVLVSVEGSICGVEAGARVASGAVTGTVGAAGIWTLMLDNVELVPVGAASI